MAVALNADNSLTFSYRIPAADRARFLRAFAEGAPFEYTAFLAGRADTAVLRATFADQQLRQFVRRWVRNFYEEQAAKLARESEVDIGVVDP
jgi:hypothetical protein